MATKKPKPESTSRSRGKDGKWKKGASGNPAGKPIQNPARRLLMQNAEALANKAIELALEGDTSALNACLNRIAPPLRGQAALVQIGAMPDDLAGQGQRILQAVTSGEIAPDIGSQLIQALSTMAKIREIDELERRVQALETAKGGSHVPTDQTDRKS